MKKIETIIFDLGRVLMHIDFDAFPNKLEIFSEDERAAYRPHVGKLWKLYETGKMATEEFIDALFPIFNDKFSKAQLLEAWNSIIVEENKEIVLLVAEIQKKYVTAILSNTSKSHWERSLKI
ncbi:MAG: putative hydrolase of the HAD superfamily, partial [Stygiobacter sp.]